MWRLIGPLRGRFYVVVGVVSTSLVGAMAASTIRQPLVLWNGTPSEPAGLYVRSAAEPGRGRIIAFQAPSAAFPYADERMGYLHRIPILKSIAAVAGDHVCIQRDRLSINGRLVAPVYDRDPQGRALPRWKGCGPLGPGEVFVFSDRVRNSFDSRYYGPVRGTAILGVFRPLATFGSKKEVS